MHTLILRWNGRDWKHQYSPSPGTNAGLSAVAATSARNAWAVGADQAGTLILHWNGHRWQRQSSFNPGLLPNAQNVALTAVSASSATNAWAVGSYQDTNILQTVSLMLHWDGRSWTRQAAPNGEVQGVVTLSASNAWAVGNYTNSQNHTLALIFHWNGQSWARQTTPNPATGYNVLNAVAATSATNVWAVGRTGQRNWALRHC